MRLQFTPSSCGGGVVVACDFANGIAVGGQLDARIMSLGSDAPRDDLRLGSSDPTILRVEGAPPTFTLTGMSPGTVTLEARTGDDTVIDHITVRVERPVRLGFKSGLDGPILVNPTTERWSVPINQLVFFQVVTKDSTAIGSPSDTPLMGRFEYQLSGSVPGQQGVPGTDGFLSVKMTAPGMGSITYTLPAASISFTAIVQN